MIVRLVAGLEPVIEQAQVVWSDSSEFQIPMYLDIPLFVIGDLPAIVRPDVCSDVVHGRIECDYRNPAEWRNVIIDEAVGEIPVFVSKLEEGVGSGIDTHSRREKIFSARSGIFSATSVS